jgi:hypothetical protein
LEHFVFAEGDEASRHHDKKKANPPAKLKAQNPMANPDAG